MAQLLEKRFGDKLGQDGNQMVRHITDATNRMTRLIEDLLSLATETALPTETRQATPMQDVFEMACAGLREEIEAAGATITAAPLPLVAARDTHILLVLQNILSNALKYRGPAPPAIEVSAVQDNSEWITSVKDNGIGIDPQYFEEIFEPFKRLHGREYEGTGIGLWSCKKIVSGYGGRIWVVSPSGKGSTFFFSLPAVHASCPRRVDGHQFRRSAEGGLQKPVTTIFRRVINNITNYPERRVLYCNREGVLRNDFEDAARIKFSAVDNALSSQQKWVRLFG